MKKMAQTGHAKKKFMKCSRSKCPWLDTGHCLCPVSCNDFKKMEKIDQVAAEILKICVDGTDFKGSPDSVKRFYRRIARWHLKELKKINDGYQSILV